MRETQSEIDQPDETEGAPAIPAAALVAGAGHPVSRAERRRQTDRDIWVLTWPVILSGILASAVALIDIAMIGRLGTDALAAVGYTMQFFWLGMSVLMAVGTACVALMSRAIGAAVPERARHAMAGSMALSVAAAVVITSVGFLFPAPLLRLLNASESVVALTLPYLKLTLLSTAVFAVSFTYESAFRAAKDTRTPMLVAAFVTVAKVGLNFVLIFGMLGFPRLDLVGAGLATFLSQGAAAVLFVFLSRRPSAPAVLCLSLRDFLASRPVLAETIRISLPAVAERLVMNLAMMSYFALLGHYGAVAVAAYTVGVRILSFSWIPGMGFSTAAATLVGQALGAEQPRSAARAGWRSARLCLISSGALGILYLLGREPLARLFVPNDPAVVDAMQPFMLMLALVQPFLALHFTLGGALRGAGDTVTPLWAAVVGNWGFRVPLAFAAAVVLNLDLFWVWFTIVFDHVSRAIWMAWSFWRGRWQENVGLETRGPR